MPYPYRRRHLRTPKIICCALAALSIAGCSTYADQNISKTKVAGNVLDRDTSYFCQDASYGTRESVYRSGEVLSHLLGFWTAKGVVLVRFKSLSKDAFSTEYLDKDLNIAGSRHYVRGTDYQVQDDGAIDIKTSSRCGAGDGPGVGCTWSHIRIFTDPAGNLAVMQATGGAGIAGIIPVAASTKYLSLFPPVTPAGGSWQDGIAACPASRASKDLAEYEKNKVVPSFAVGDVVVPYRHYDSKQKAFLPGPAQGLENTKWQVIEIAARHIRLELIEGEYRPLHTNGAVYRAGAFATDFSSSNRYMEANRYGGYHGQIFQEFRKAD